MANPNIRLHTQITKGRPVQVTIEFKDETGATQTVYTTFRLITGDGLYHVEMRDSRPGVEHPVLTNIGGIWKVKQD